MIAKNHRTTQSTLHQAVQAARPNVISPLTNNSSTIAKTVATPQENYPQIITSILSGQTANSLGEFSESDLLFRIIGFFSSNY